MGCRLFFSSRREWLLLLRIGCVIKTLVFANAGRSSDAAPHWRKRRKKIKTKQIYYYSNNFFQNAFLCVCVCASARISREYRWRQMLCCWWALIVHGFGWVSYYKTKTLMQIKSVGWMMRFFFVWRSSSCYFFVHRQIGFFWPKHNCSIIQYVKPSTRYAYIILYI